MSKIKKVLLWLAGLMAAAAMIVGVMMAFFDLRFDRDGTGVRPLPYVDRTEQRLKEIEQRAAVEHQPTPQAAAPEPTATPIEADMSAPWPRFYGARQDGTYREGPININWPSKGLPEVWRRPVGGGYASMAVAQGRVFTIEQRRDQEVAAAYDLKTGRELWANSWKALFQESMGGDGPRATPSWADGRLYVLGAEGELRCLDALTGKTLWRTNILSDSGSGNTQWGMAASPLVVDDMVVVMPGKGVTAYDRKSGGKLWSTLEDKTAYTAPMIATLNGQRQIVVVTGQRALGLALDGSKVLWSHPWKTDYDTNSALPLIVDWNHLILTAGYGHGSTLIEISADGARELWRSKAMKCKFNNAVLYQGVVYGLDEGILAAMDAQTGQKNWKGGRYGFGQLLLAGEHLVVLSESGEVALVKASPTGHEEVARFEAISGKTWNVPAMAHGLLLVRNGAEMACYRIAR
jgi:outer membrane protein assembly factor BamB